MTPKSRMEEAKASAQKEVLSMIESYFARYETAASNKKLTIDMVEDFMGEAMAEGERIIKGAASIALKAMEYDLVEKKPYAPDVAEN